MLKAVGKIAEEFNVPAELSMDEHMCCGVGVCLTCVIPVKTGDGWEYQRTCTEGPVFDAARLCGRNQMNLQFSAETSNIQHSTSTSNQPEYLIHSMLMFNVEC